MMTPIVIELDDDNCDGKVDEKDIPEIVFATFTSGDYNDISHQGTLHAISIVGGQVVDKWSVGDQYVRSGTQIAGGNIDGVPGNEIVACTSDSGGGSHVTAFHGDGTVLWTTSGSIGCGMASNADLDGDGHAEVVVHGGVIDGATGTIKVPMTFGVFGLAIVDLDGDGQLDITNGQTAHHADGSKFADSGLTSTDFGPGIGDFDLDGVPEVVSVDYKNHSVSLWHYDPTAPNKATIVRSAVDINGSLSQSLCPPGSSGSSKGGGPATVVDFNGDGHPDVALAGGIGYAVLDGKKLMDPSVAGPDTFLFPKQTHDCSSAATGSSLFDFNGDGKVEVRLAVAVPDNGPKQSGIRVFGSQSGDWVRTRRIWNHHAYHVTNVNEDGTIPAHEASNWTQPGLNNWRQNKQPGLEFAAPDAVVTIAPLCSDNVFAATVAGLCETDGAGGGERVQDRQRSVGAQLSVLETVSPQDDFLALLVAGFPSREKAPKT